MPHIARHGRRTVLLACALLAAVPAAASAATVNESIEPLPRTDPSQPERFVQFFTLGSNTADADVITVSYDPARQEYTFTDRAGLLPPYGAPAFDPVNDDCRQLDPTTVVCHVNLARSSGAPAERAIVSVSPHAGDDVIDTRGVSTGEVQVFGGDGDDTITTGASADIVEADAGDDTVDTGDGDDYAADGPGSDFIRGGAGNDQFPVVGGGPDTFDGGDGNDSFFPRDVPTGVVHYLGGAGDDEFTAGTTPGTIDAGPGNDDISTIRDTRSYRREIATSVTCGPGVDLMTPGPRDRVHLDCEHLNHPDVYCSKRSCRVGTTLYSLRRGRLARDLVSRVSTVRGNDSVAWVPLTSRAVRRAVKLAPRRGLKVELNLIGTGLYLHKNPRLVLIR